MSKLQIYCIDIKTSKYSIIVFSHMESHMKAENNSLDINKYNNNVIKM